MFVIVFNVCAIFLHNHYIPLNQYSKTIKNLPTSKFNCFGDIIKCVFELNESDKQTYKKPIKMNKTQADDLVKKIDKGRY